MEKFYYVGLLENPFFKGGSHKKNNIQGGVVQKGGLRQFADLREGGLAKKKAMHFI